LDLQRQGGLGHLLHVKSDAAIKHTPILALTSATTAEDRDEAYSAGCDGYKAKPIDVERLETRIKELIV
jgi:two-component system cell cycle response regulator DivK